jgi:NADH-quinone oxidoreductase subunit J
MDPVLPIFYILAIGVIASGVMVVVQKNPVICAMFLVTVMLCLAGIYLLLFAEFIAAIQVIVYAGAVMVLFLFVIMLLNLEKEVKASTRSPFQKTAGLVLGILLVGILAAAVFAAGQPVPGPRVEPGAVSNSVSIGRMLFSRYLLPFEITSVILLIAIIGVILIGKKNL